MVVETQTVVLFTMGSLSYSALGFLCALDKWLWGTVPYRSSAVVFLAVAASIFATVARCAVFIFFRSASLSGIVTPPWPPGRCRARK